MPPPPQAGSQLPPPSAGGPPAPYQGVPSPYQGAPVPYQVGGPQSPQTVLSLLAMIFGIVGVALSCCYGAGFLFSVAGVVLGHLGLKRESARGMALAGLITGYVGVAGALIFWVALFGLALSPLLFLPLTAA